MTVNTLDHVNIRVKDPEATATFFVEVLDMPRKATRPNWILDAGDRPVIHLGRADDSYDTDRWRPFTARGDSGAVHHVALGCSGYDALIGRLRAMGLDYEAVDLPGGVRQIFVMEPGGVMLELNFAGA